ncbi:single-stranded DNA-binding protein [Staphylococcus sp. SQ8-PEA]|uniref:Single-stranded DNA-binding protein n=1 Tax=Staphylococcus marylandisciuri TaxID=2981529 RepID=A0ABT2QRJ4_9STAP|nr:single-stranded DNA-binding protein [Staphylococcus marylandisciuri]MCU5746562.1 single-stranded DNA-binding protein [Staphylococcus marylandisciuri]
MINNMTIVGRLTRDPHIYDKEGVKRATFTVAVERRYRDKAKEKVVDYIYCKAFGKLATNIEKYLTQGSLVGITGQLHSSKYEKEGQTHFVTELNIEYIRFMSPRKSTIPNSISSDNNPTHSIPIHEELFIHPDDAIEIT